MVSLETQINQQTEQRTTERKDYIVKKIFNGTTIIHLSGLTKDDAQATVEYLKSTGTDAWAVSE